MPDYLWLKALHVLAVVLFLGNITTGLFWATHAHRTRDMNLIGHAFRGIIRSDRWFTVPGVIGIIATGVAAALLAHLPLLGTGWVLWGIVLFALSGVVFGWKVAPLQQRIVTLAAGGTSIDGWNEYAGIYRRWELWGLLALAAPLAAAVIMVLKPDLPAF